MPRGTCAELIALSVLCCMLVMSRSDRQYSSTGVIGEEKTRRGPRWRTKSTTKAKRPVHTPTTGTWYLVLGLIPATWWYSVLNKAQGSAPRAADAARYARARKNATETFKGGRKKRPVIIWCEQGRDNAKRCLCTANCPALCWVLVHVTF